MDRIGKELDFRQTSSLNKQQLSSLTVSSLFEGDLNHP
jgi:hypothetical protein